MLGLLVAALSWQSHAPPSRRVQQCTQRVPSPCAVILPPGGADLQGGRNESRNAEVAALKRLFFLDDDDSAQDEAASDTAEVGYYPDMPLARWGCQPFLPHQQVLLNLRPTSRVPLQRQDSTSL